MLKNIVIKNRYYDSATLMLLTNKVKESLGLNPEDIAIMMATEMNKRIIAESALLDQIGENANPGDVLIAIRTELEQEKILELIEKTLSQKNNKKLEKNKAVTSIQEALALYDNDINFAVISLPGLYAAREAKKLLNAGKHILLFSDNVSIEDEINLKNLAIEKDLLMMGPDCGTAIINGVGLGFANKVNKGNIGIVAASGTGLQEVATIISNHGGGISNAFGTGGRDIQDIVGGKMMLYCLDLLIKDKNTDIIVIVSKPPQAEVLNKIKEKLREVNKIVIACFLGADPEIFKDSNIIFSPSLAGAAKKALEANGIMIKNDFNIEKISEELNRNNRQFKYIRGIYCGGTLAYETLLMLKSNGYTVYSNLSKDKDKKLTSKQNSREHTVIDMGDDEFTLGKPHPMIDPIQRSERFLQEALDSNVSILLADVELGYGSNDSAAEILCKDIEAIYQQRSDIVIIVIICGSKDDYQNYDEKKQLFEKAGAIVAPSNSEAVELAMTILKG
ncbi:FdrA family protein [Mergibacter septicus]|uniref:FdrA family protein n=1 Tax=Mergibacter septicus TaxID=221402 RepID=A0A8E3MG81_9PAST|nr:acyl-CoA synthetase FdrA [Mergibacter septicus]AWX15439.1 FdrA family protein [Mergibacter septicus]QDJ14692.1 FdrA family protein [Mergibacter septicus]UTU47879.1 acyl-CoA synthetase FdrA [Mergibacter septicus]WMR96514.1 acyl-CoA synthetase FdrA [Mergibacter septicus]